MISYALILTFMTNTQTEEYVVDPSLTHQDCIERMNEEIKDSEHESNNQMYRDAVERYKAVKMDGSIVEAFYQCAKGE